jgi:tRNA(adenine34) deaminase
VATNYQEGLLELYKKIRPGEPLAVESAESLIFSMFFDSRRYDLAKVGRYKFNKKLALRNRIAGHVLAEDVVNMETGEVIAEAYNTREASKCATHHAEILAIEEACRRLGGWRLPDCTLYVSLEPCPMCAGACVNARIDRVVYAAPDLRAGAFGSKVDLNDLDLNHKPKITAGVCCEESKSVLSAYFRAKRKKKSE